MKLLSIDVQELLKNTVPISSVIDSAHEYDAVMMPGGHGTVVDFPVSVELKTVIEKVYKNSGIVATVCHGPVCLISPVIDGLPLVHGEHVSVHRVLVTFDITSL